MTKLHVGMLCVVGGAFVLVPTGDSAQPSWEGSPIHTSNETRAILDHLMGAWSGEGELFGQPATFGMTWETQLYGRFLELTYEISGAVQMIAIAHYRTTGDTLRGVWVDSRGEILQLQATVTDSTLDTIWQSPTETGRTVYQSLSADSLYVRDYVRGESGWREFGAARYARR